MATSVKMTDDGKVRLDRLQARLLAECGKKYTQQELLDRLLALGEYRFSDLVGDQRSLSAAERKRIMSLPKRSGRPIRPEDYDDILYGRVR